jgi:molybdopterin converting factor subunit 1
LIAHVRLFAAAREAAGAGAVELELPAGATVGQLRVALGDRFPDLQPLLGQCRFAVDAAYVDDQAVIPAGADLACIPPVSGG